MTDHTNIANPALKSTSKKVTDRGISISDARDVTEHRATGFNKYIYQNLVCNIEEQVHFWNRSAVRNPNPEAAHALWLKAEGLGYALRLLYAFEPEFRELVECASPATTGGTIQQ